MCISVVRRLPALQTCREVVMVSVQRIPYARPMKTLNTESHDVLKKAVTEVGAKAIAAEMSLSSSLIYKWCEPKDSPDAAGTGNPLDRLARIYELTSDVGPIVWLCERAGGFFTPNTVPDDTEGLPLLSVTHKILREFSEVHDSVSESVENDGSIDPEEVQRIRHEWEELKRVTEGFVLACERGEYRQKRRG